MQAVDKSFKLGQVNGCPALDMLQTDFALTYCCMLDRMQRLDVELEMLGCSMIGPAMRFATRSQMRC